MAAESYIWSNFFKNVFTPVSICLHAENMELLCLNK